MIDLHGIVRLVLKLSGVGLIVYGAVSLATYLPPLLISRSPEEIVGFLPYILPLAVPFLLGALLWFFPASVANTVVRSSPAKESKANLGYEIERVGVSLLGLYLFYRAVSDIIYEVMKHQAKTALLGNVRAPDDFPALVTATSIEFVLALLFMLQARGVVNLLRKARGH